MQKILSKININGPGGCWLWTGSIDKGGYGHYGRKPFRFVHRFVYELAAGPIPKGLVLDHLCRVRHCCNPTHLEPVTHKENSVRGLVGATSAKRQMSKTHCPKGHEYNEENTYVGKRKATGKAYRVCRPCARELDNKRYKEEKSK